MSKVSKFPHSHPLWTACLLVAAGAVAGYVWASKLTGKPQEALFVASTTLVFGALLGGAVKFLLEDLQRLRERRAEDARFVKQMLDDLKSVYDRVERARILIAAHQSALTYGNEMRDLIDSEVQLHNVIRAIETKRDILNGHKEHRKKLETLIDRMRDYVHELTKEFRGVYKGISNEQSVYEAKAKLARENAESLPPNEAWDHMRGLKRLAEFLDFESSSSGGYDSSFVQMLNAATWILRAELKRLGDGSKFPELPTYIKILGEPSDRQPS